MLIAVPDQASETYLEAPEVPEQASEMHAKTPETYAKAPKIYGQTEIKKPEAEETRVLATATDLYTGSDVKHTEAEEELFPSDARLQALIEEKQRKEHDIALLEAQSKKEAEALRERNRRAKAEYVSAQYSAKEEEYRRDIMALNARIREIESTRSATRDYYENSYSVYRSATEDSLYGKSALYDDTTSRSAYEFDSLPADDTEISDTPLYQNKKAAYYDEEIPEKNDKKKRKKKKAEKDELYSTDEFSKRNEKRAILDDYKAYNEKYGAVSDKKNSYSDDYASAVNDREAELKKKYAKYFADDEDYGSYAQPVAEHKSDYGYPLVDESAVRISHESDPVSKNPESAPKSSKGYDKDDTDLAEGADAFLEDAETITDAKAMKRRELNQYLKTAAKTEKKLKKAIKQEERKYTRTSVTEKPEKLIDVMSAKRDLFDLYVSNYMVCTASSDKKDARFFGKCAKQLVRDYNRDLSNYEKLTAQTQTHAENPVDYIKKHGTPPTLPLPAAEKGKNEDGAKASRKDRKREQLAYAKDYSDKRRKDKRGRKDAYAQAKQRIANDEQTVAARVDYRINKYDYEITRSKFRFGEETGADRRTRKRLLAKLKTMRTGRKSAIKREVENNARYLEVAVADANTVKRRRGAEINDVRAVCERVSLLLTERDGINRRLNSLYRESESVFSASKNSRKRISELKLSVARRVFKSQLKEYRRVSKYPIPLKNKQPLYDAMNDKIELSATKAELEYRLKSERPKGEVRAEMRERLRETKAELRRIDKDIQRLRKKITARVKRTDRPKHQFVWLLVLLLVAALVTVAFVFLKDEMIALFNKIWDFTMNIFKKNG